MNWQQQAIDHAEQEKPNEACGILAIVDGLEKYFPCRNIANEPTHMFVIHPDDWVTAEDQGTVVGVFHSHVGNSAKPSEVDVKFADAMTAKWYIYATESSAWEVYYPSKLEVNLLGREWIWRHQDCGTLCVDWYRQHGIDISMFEFKRPATLKEYMNNPGSLNDHLALCGFKELASDDSWLYGDLLLFGQNAVNPHGGIYIGNQTVIHHCVGRLSTEELLDAQLLKALSKRFRHLEFAKIKKA